MVGPMKRTCLALVALIALSGCQPKQHPGPPKLPEATPTRPARTPAELHPTWTLTTSATPTPSRPAPTTKPAAAGEAETDPRYSSCAQAIAHHLGPYVRGTDPEYTWYRDKDGDGIVCER